MNVLRAQPIRLGLAALITASFVVGVGAQEPQQPMTPTFKTTVDVVSVTAVVRDGKGRVVRNLTREDFQVYEKGQPRKIVDFKASDQGPISLAVLFDVSGSMRESPNMVANKKAVDHILS